MKLKKKKSKKRKIFSFYSKGKTSVYMMLLVVVILGSILLAQGLTPKSMTSTDEGGGESILISEAPQPGRSNLQLDTLKFRKCAEKVAIDFLVDTSGSMDGSKLNNLQQALKFFGSKFPDNGVVGIQIFSGPQPAQELIPISLYKDVKRTFNNKIDSMYAYGSTYTRDAFEFAKPKLLAAKAAYPNQKFALIFISDGIPEVTGCGREEQKNGCTAAEAQDPNKAPSIPDEIKGNDIRIFSIAYLDRNDDFFDNKLKELMRNASSMDSNPPCPADAANVDFCIAPIGNQLDNILARISSKFCSD